MKYDFNKKRVWVTGASSGIGLALARQLVKAGAFVAVTSRSRQDLIDLFLDNERFLIVPGDMTSRETNDQIVEKIEEEFGGLDCVILNAGSAEYIDIQNFSEQPFERMMQTNFLSMVKGIAASLPLLRQSNTPYLVGMSSSVAWQGLPQAQAYSASKAAIRNLFQGLRIQLSVENVAVSWICPGFVKTPLTDKNSFPMPFKISAESAAKKILEQLSRQKAEIHFPKLFTYFLRLISLLPVGLSAKMLVNTVPKKSKGYVS
jgi:short-subunit dehydrogenase